MLINDKSMFLMLQLVNWFTLSTRHHNMLRLAVKNLMFVMLINQKLQKQTKGWKGQT